METLICPACGSTNPSDAMLCSFCNSYLRPGAYNPLDASAPNDRPVGYIPPDKSAPREFDWLDRRIRLYAVLSIFGFAFCIGPAGARLALQTFGSNLTMLAIVGIIYFPRGLASFIETLFLRQADRFILGVPFDTIIELSPIIGWAIYITIVILIFVMRDNKLVRNLIIGLVILVVLNIAGCYQSPSLIP